MPSSDSSDPHPNNNADANKSSDITAAENRIFFLIIPTPIFVEPCVGAGVGRHTPIAAGRERHAAHLRSVGRTAAFELLREKAAIEFFQSGAQFLISVNAAERDLGKAQDFARTEAAAYRIIEEKVVEIVRPYYLFGLLPFSAGISSGLMGVSRMSRSAFAASSLPHVSA